MSTDRSCIAAPGARACINCTAWRAYGDVGLSERGNFIGRMPVGECRANPPSRDASEIGTVTAMWPVVRADDICRAFEGRPRAQAVA